MGIIDKVKDFVGINDELLEEFDDFEETYEEPVSNRKSRINFNFSKNRNDVVNDEKPSFGQKFTSSSNRNAFANLNRERSFSNSSRDNYTFTKDKKEEPKVVNLNDSNVRVVVSKPTEFNNVTNICSLLRSQMTIVLNLKSVTEASDRRRIFDFISGCCYAVDGNMQQIDELIYLVSPCTVGIFGDAEELTSSYDYSEFI